MIKEKKCKGSGLAIGYGCGKLTQFRVYGLGKMCGCYSNWLLNSENGKIKLQKSILKIQKPRLDLETKEREEKENKSLKLAKLNTKTQVHAFVRERDKGKSCISCEVEWNETFQAGHFYKSETFETLKYHLDNIHGQCFRCNNFLDGNFDNYSLNLTKRIGIDRYDKLVKLAKVDKHHSKVWNLENLKQIREDLKKHSI